MSCRTGDPGGLTWDGWREIMKKSHRNAPMIRLAIILVLAMTLDIACGRSAEPPSEKAAAATAKTVEAVFPLEETTIAGLQEMMTSGKSTAEELVKLYFERIDKVDQGVPGLNAVIQKNPDALAIARELDMERKEKGPRGPLHGVPVLIKDNIDTADQMETTAGSLALLGLSLIHIS